MAAVPQVARISLRNILFPTDFSTASAAALPFAAALARLYDATIQMAHVVVPESHPQVLSPRFPAENESAWEQMREQLRDCTDDKLVRDIRCQSLLVSGSLGDVIPAIVREHDIDLVVVGTHGRTGFSKMMLGSGAEKIYRTASCPVLTVGPHVPRGEWKLRRILCPVEITENPAPALDYALSLAEENQAAFLIMRAVPMVPWQHRAAMELQTWQQLRSLLPERASDWCKPEFLVSWEHPAEAILATASDRQADLIVLGVRKSRAAALSSHLPWPVASEVVSRALCPVLTVRV